MMITIVTRYSRIETILKTVLLFIADGTFSFNVLFSFFLSFSSSFDFLIFNVFLFFFFFFLFL